MRIHKNRVGGVWLGGLLLVCAGQLAGQVIPSNRATSTVQLRSVNVFGRPIDGFNIDEFRREGGEDFSARLNHTTMVQVPFGTYRVTASRAGYRDFEAVVEVLGAQTLVTVCFETEPMEDSGGRILTPFRGKIDGAAFPDAGGGFCKVTGVYLRLQYESAIRGPDAGFDFGLVAPGMYTLNCHWSSDVVLVRELKVDGGAKPFVVGAMVAESTEQLQRRR